MGKFAMMMRFGGSFAGGHRDKLLLAGDRRGRIETVSGQCMEAGMLLRNWSLRSASPLKPDAALGCGRAIVDEHALHDRTETSTCKSSRHSSTYTISILRREAMRRPNYGSAMHRNRARSPLARFNGSERGPPH